MDLEQNPEAHHKHLHVIDLTLCCLPELVIIYVIILWSTASKAFFTSINTAPTNLLLSSCSRMFSATQRTAAMVEKSFIKPDCLPLVTKKSRKYWMTSSGWNSGKVYYTAKHK